MTMTKAQRIIHHFETGFAYPGDLQRDLIDLLTQHDVIQADLDYLQSPDTNIFMGLMNDVIDIDADELGCIETTNPEDKIILKQACERIDALHDKLFSLVFPKKDDKPC